MLEKDTDFLPFFFQEPVYLISEPDLPLAKENAEEDTASDEDAYLPLGENCQQILVLVDEPREYHLAEENRVLLDKILQALNLNLKDTCVINVAHAVSPDRVKGAIDFTICLSFGMPPEPWQFSNFFRKYEVMEDETGRAFLFADSLTEIGQDVEKKKRLWLHLKTLFQKE